MPKSPEEIAIRPAITSVCPAICKTDVGRERPRSCPLPDGRLAQVFYVPCAGEETEIQLPDGCCQVSGDNAGGFIVTAWGRPA